jgi:hypothetical protein
VDQSTPYHRNAHAGLHYSKFIERLAINLSPSTYLEIGTFSGKSLSKVNCSSIAIDPGFRISSDVIGKKPMTLFYQMTSDNFFQKFSPTSILGRKIDLAFLDGMHLFEYLLRDFFNTEKHCAQNSIIMLHDCLPTNVEMTSRKRLSGAWTGDVWKVPMILKRYRPEIELTFLDCAPTGLLICTNLNPSSEVLEKNYVNIVREFENMEVGEKLEKIYCAVEITDAGDYYSEESI